MATGHSFKNPEMIIAGSALIVSLITAFASIYSAFIDRAYARSSVWPRLEIHRSYDGSGAYFSYGVNNKGTGPAVIKYAKLSYDNKVLKSWPDYLQMRSFLSDKNISQLFPMPPNTKASRDTKPGYLHLDAPFLHY